MRNNLAENAGSSKPFTHTGLPFCVFLCVLFIFLATLGNLVLEFGALMRCLAIGGLCIVTLRHGRSIGIQGSSLFRIFGMVNQRRKQKYPVEDRFFSFTTPTSLVD
jgi:hypothetical protein